MRYQIQSSKHQTILLVTEIRNLFGAWNLGFGISQSGGLVSEVWSLNYF